MPVTTALAKVAATCYAVQADPTTCLWGANLPYASTVHTDDAVAALDANPYA